MRAFTRTIVLPAIVVGSLVLGPVGARAAGPEGCVASNPPGPQSPTTCHYVAKNNGGLVGGGSFKVVIKRGRKTITYTQAKGNNQMIGAIKPKDKVTATAVSSGSWVAVGNPVTT